MGGSTATAGCATYRFRATLHSRWAGYLTIVVLVGLLGGVAMGSLAAARRTQSAFPTYLSSTNPSNLALETGGWQEGQPNSAGASLAGAQLVSHLPRVTRLANAYSLNAQVLDADGYPRGAPAEAKSLGLSTLNSFGSLDGEYVDVDRATAVEGHLPDPDRPDEIDLAPVVAQVLHVHVGETIPIGFYTNAQSVLPGYGTSSGFKVKPDVKVDMKVVGLVDVNNQVVVDSLDATGAAILLYSPAVTRQLLSCCVTSVTTYLQLAHGNRDVPRVESEIDRLAAANGLASPFFSVQPSLPEAESAIRPESIALAVFGGIAALAALLIAAQAIGRQVRLGTDERRTLRALGAGPATIVADTVLGLVVAVVAGSTVAVAVAVALSPLAPIGIVRPVYPFPGVAFDWTVLGLGWLVLVVLLCVTATVLTILQSPHRHSADALAPARVPASVRTAAAAGLPVPAVEGIRFAVDPGQGRSSVPVRSAVVGALIAVVVLVATVTFGASLDSLVSHPGLYGWNWDYELTGGGGIAPVPGAMASRLLDRDPAVGAWSSMVFGGQAVVNGALVPVLGQRPGATVTPLTLSGHALDASGEIVLGGATLRSIHERIGDVVNVRIPSGTTHRLVIVGTATMPTVGIQIGGTHTTMGTGALVPAALIPNIASNPNEVTPAGPSAILVRLKGNSNDAAGLASLRKIAVKLTLPENYGVSVLSVQRPAEIINYRSMGTIPAILGLGLAAGATIALCLTLVASVRRRRRDLALFKSLGFTRRQLAATVAWQATVAVGIGTVVGVPVGIVVGRALWDVFANQIDAVALPSVPGLVVAAIGLGALVLAVLVAAIPGRLAANTPTALLLRAE
ncbi:MAG TPA: FtsX-like permease family protein [Acidimicrobiales bacterium]|nr:FtsX-like permease family protein [Acidimicrobiales bacterium]